VKKLFAAEKSSLIFAQEIPCSPAAHLITSAWMLCGGLNGASKKTWCFIPECHSCIAKEA